MDSSQLAALQDRLRTAQATARRLRAEAFVRYSPDVAGQVLMPMTLDTYNLLVAWENPFVCGGPCDFEHLFQFVWIHHPDFGQHAHAARRRVMAAVLRALRPRRPNLSALARALSPLPRLRWLRRFIEPTATELEQAAVDECSRLVVEAIGDFPSDRSAPDAANGAPAEALPFSLQAQVLNLLRRELGIGFAEARAMPLKELSQHLRECVWSASAGKAFLPTPAEAAVWRDYLAATGPATSA